MDEWPKFGTNIGLFTHRDVAPMKMIILVFQMSNCSMLRTMSKGLQFDIFAPVIVNSW